MKPNASPEYPWVQQEVIDWLEAKLRPNWTVLETGAGGSTVFFAKRVRRVVSFENDPMWHSVIVNELRDRHLANVIRLWDPDYPLAGLRLKGLGALENSWLDLAFIDGRGRVKSVEDALPAVKPNGYLILDDSNRNRYAPVIALMDTNASDRITFQNGVDQTTIWRLKA